MNDEAAKVLGYGVKAPNGYYLPCAGLDVATDMNAEFPHMEVVQHEQGGHLVPVGAEPENLDEEPFPQVIVDAGPSELNVIRDPYSARSLPQYDVWIGQRHVGVIFDESEATLNRGSFAAWSPKAGTRQGTVGFYDTKDGAADAIRQLYPVSAADLAKALGVESSDVAEAAHALADEWSAKGPRAVILSAPTDAVELTAAAADAIRDRLTREPEKDALAPPEWRTLKGVTTPFQIYGQEQEGGRFHPASDRKKATGEPLTIVRTWMHGTRYGEDQSGRTIDLWGVATKYWVSQG
ncbi:hypothetical protein [Streptomyces sp. NPDC051554]|uniref:hypothetical protein n=1 Tax=Streptomyces sp. NPDC051554 TaxID=3365656 RepID=UPI0037ABBCD1